MDRNQTFLFLMSNSFEKEKECWEKESDNKNNSFLFFTPTPEMKNGIIKKEITIKDGNQSFLF